MPIPVAIRAGLTPSVLGRRKRVPSIVLSGMSVSESATVGAVIGTLQVANPGAGTWTFAKVSDPDAKFSVVGGALKLAATVDYEAKTSHSVTLEATDGTTTLSRTISIAVIDAAEGGPYLLLESGGRLLLESGGAILLG